MEFSFILLLIIAALCFVIGWLVADARWRKRLPQEREDATKRSRAVIGGQFSEQLAPYLPDFPYKPTEVKFLGKPTDFLVFEGLDEKKISRVVFVEVKSGKAQLSATERSLRDCVDNGKVSFETYSVPGELTK